MTLPRLRLVASAIGLTLVLAGCSQGSGDQAASAPQEQAPPDDSARQLETYRELLKIHNDEMAVTMGHQIVSSFPNSDAAKEVQQTLPEIEQRWKETSEKARLVALWLYQVSPMAGGTQSTASIHNSKPVGEDPVNLVLRRHTAWGQSVFLYGSGHGFVCRANCTLKATFDDKPGGIRAFAPSTGEPALMFADDKGFIAQLAKARKITIEVTRVDTGKQETLVYETAGFDTSKWQPLAKAAGKK